MNTHNNTDVIPDGELRLKNIGSGSYLLVGTHRVFNDKELVSLAKTHPLIIDGGFGKHTRRMWKKLFGFTPRRR